MTSDINSKESSSFRNDDTRLLDQAACVLETRRECGLEGLVKGLDHVVLNVEKNRFQDAVTEWLRFTGFKISACFENEAYQTCVLQASDSADIVIRTRLQGVNPFKEVNQAPKTSALPDTRLETFVFETPDLKGYVEIQRDQGVAFLTPDIIETEHYLYIQTKPSPYTGNSIGLIQWIDNNGVYQTQNDRALEIDIELPQTNYQNDIGLLDHAATRVTAENRDAAILEFMSLTNYRFEGAFYIEELNSITNVARLAGENFALVFTSGIHPFADMPDSGPTEQFVQNYGPRVHHLALQTEDIDNVYAALKKDGTEFLSGLVGSREEGLKQAFTVPSPNSLLVIEYIHRFDGFDGFFTRNNVARLTAATSRQ